MHTPEGAQSAGVEVGMLVPAVVFPGLEAGWLGAHKTADAQGVVHAGMEVAEHRRRNLDGDNESGRCLEPQHSLPDAYDIL